MLEDETVENAGAETTPETTTAQAVEVNSAKAEAKLERNKKLLVGYQAELKFLDPMSPIRKEQLENKIADLEKQIKG